MIKTLAVSGYRSLRDIRVELGKLTVVTGPNGSGKSSFYRALRLMNDIAHGAVVGSLASEGGLSSALWAGPEAFSRAVKAGELPVQGTRRKHPIALKLGFSSDDYGYAIELGLPGGQTMFSHDPQIKLELLWLGDRPGRANVIAERRGPTVQVRNREGAWVQVHATLDPYDSMMTHCSDPRDGLELLLLRDRMRDWRFYDHLRTDVEAPARRPQVGTRTDALASDGRDLAAAIQTIREIGAADALRDAIGRAFPGSSITVVETGLYFDLEMHQHGLLRPLRTTELSEGTLKFLLLVAALFSPRPPTLMILNEPETSLHADLVPALARIIGEASARSQIIVVSHAELLIRELKAGFDCRAILLGKEFGETLVESDGDQPAWTWPKR